MYLSEEEIKAGWSRDEKRHYGMMREYLSALRQCEHRKLRGQIRKMNWLLAQGEIQAETVKAIERVTSAVARSPSS